MPERDCDARECLNCLSILDEEMRPRSIEAFKHKGHELIDFNLTLSTDGFTATITLENSNSDIPDKIQLSHKDPGQLIENIEAYAKCFKPRHQ